MSLIPTVMLARTKDSQPAKLPVAFLRLVGEGEYKKACIILWGLCMGFPLSSVPTQGKGTREDTTQLFFSFPPPQMGGKEEVAGKLV